LANISMTEVPLMCHPMSDAGGIAGINVTIRLDEGGQIALTYRVSGELGALEVASPTAPERVDGLWKTTCFELFVGNSESENYLEYNFAPSRQWAAYQFASYRSDVSELETEAPNIAVARNENMLTVAVTLALPDIWRARDLRAGISAVLATHSGDMSYWAAAHPPSKPDFHHKDCFVVQLDARSAT
jgi:hypothetical protein